MFEADRNTKEGEGKALCEKIKAFTDKYLALCERNK